MATDLEDRTRRIALIAVLAGTLSGTSAMAGVVTIYCDEAAQVTVTRKNPDGTIDTLYNSGYRTVGNGPGGSGFTDKILISIPSEYQSLEGTSVTKAVRDGGRVTVGRVTLKDTASLASLEPFSIADLAASARIASIYSLPDYLGQEGGLLPNSLFVGGFATGVSALRVVDASSLDYSSTESAIYDFIARGDALPGYSGNAQVGLTRTTFEVPSPGASALALGGLLFAWHRRR